MYTQNTVSHNKYHAAYVGAYQYLAFNQMPLPKSIDKSCIGIDSWGDKQDLQYGAIRTSIGTDCFDRHRNTTFKESLTIYLQNPDIILKLPFDKGVKGQFGEQYFHVIKNLPMIIDNTGPLLWLSQAKDAVFNNLRIPILFIVFIYSIIIRKKTYSGLLFFLSAFALSQFYISFLGEGYRDLNKHLFPMNFSFDLLLFSILSLYSTQRK